MYKDLLNSCDNVTIECDKRLKIFLKIHLRNIKIILLIWVKFHYNKI